jgi:hypothetical protein
MDEDWFDFFVLDPLGHYNPLTDAVSNRLTRAFIQSTNRKITDLIVDAISQGNYVIINLDDYYTPPSAFYQKENKGHGVLIYGYDLDNQVFDIAGYYENQRYKTEKLNFFDLELAYKHADKWVEKAQEGHETFYYMDYMNVVHLLKVNPQGKYPFNIQSVIEQLSDYLYSRNTNERYLILENRYTGAYGLSVYAYLCSVLEQLLKAPIADRIAYSDHRPLYILMEHKRLMISRIHYMQSHGYLANIEEVVQGYNEIESEIVFILNQFGKFLLKGSSDDSYIVKIVDALTLIAEKERKVLKQLLDQLAQMKVPLTTNS